MDAAAIIIGLTPAAVLMAVMIWDYDRRCRRIIRTLDRIIAKLDAMTGKS